MKTRAKGMTIIELMIAILVLGILMGIAVPSFRAYTANSRSASATNGLVTALSLARSEALKRSNPATVCASTNQTNCSGSTNWATGWIVATDANGNGAIDAGEVIQTWPALDGGMTSTSDQASVVYGPAGNNQLNLPITFVVVPPGCDNSRAVQTVVTVTGTLHTNKIVCP
jgi:type IV fimbrial biogenesis protein FimT